MNRLVQYDHREWDPTAPVSFKLHIPKLHQNNGHNHHTRLPNRSLCLVLHISALQPQNFKAFLPSSSLLTVVHWFLHMQKELYYKTAKLIAGDLFCCSYPVPDPASPIQNHFNLLHIVSILVHISFLHHKFSIKSPNSACLLVLEYQPCI